LSPPIDLRNYFPDQYRNLTNQSMVSMHSMTEANAQQRHPKLKDRVG